MEVSEFFLKFLVILLSAKLFAELFAYFRIPAVLGEVTAGIVIGPSLLGFIEPDATLHLLAEIGILFLLFQVGLETDVGRIIKVGVQSILVALTGVILPAAAGFYIARFWFDLPLLPSLFIGGAVVATSIGITVRVLADLNKKTTVISRIVLGAAVLDDIIGVVILAALYDFSVTGRIGIAETVRVVFFIALFLLAAPVITRFFIPAISQLSAASRTQGMIPTLVVSLILGLAVVAHEAGAPEILGSFAAGIALARRFFMSFGAKIEGYTQGLAEEIEKGMTPIIDLFTPVFFVMVGVSINFQQIDFTSGRFWWFAGALSIAAILTKAVSGIWVRGGWKCRLSTGVAMVPRGEVGLIFAELGRRNGIFDDALFAVIVFVVAVTTLLAPLALRPLMKDLPEECSTG